MTKTKARLSESDIAIQLVERIIEGDRRAEQEMIERYQRGLRAMLFNRCQDRALAEDVAQDTWLLVLQKVRENNLKDSSKLAAFIIQIGKNQLIMKYRKESHRQHEGDESMQFIADGDPTPEQRLINSQLGESISKLMKQLSQPRDRELLRRFYLMGDEKKELCKQYDITESHFDRVIYRARERFKSLWQTQPDQAND